MINTTRKIHLTVFFSLFVGLIQAQQPNILLVISDDIGVDATSGYFDADLLPTTPTLDSLRSVGLTFNNVWANPKCTPTRASIMSGKYGVKTGATNTPGNLDTSHTSIFRALEQYAPGLYSNAVIGKWHISAPVNFNHPALHGIDHFVGSMSSGVEDYYNWEKVENGVASMETTYVTSYLTDRSIDFIAAQDQPWLLWLAHNAPHAPVHEPPSDLYHINAVGTNFRKYVAMMEALDTELGRLLESLSEEESANTLVIYIGDNGTPGSFLQEYPNGHGKSTLYEGGVHVPLIVAGAGVDRRGENEDALINASDLYATILESAGLDLPGGIYNSLSFEPLLRGTEADKRDYLYAELGEDWTIRNRQYKLIQYSDGSQEFFDLEADPLEFSELLISGELNDEASAAKADLELEASVIRSDWSCRDFIQNGEEIGIDCGGACAPCTVTSTLEEEVSLEVVLFPNPVQEMLNIQADHFAIESIRIFSQNGQLLESSFEMNTYGTEIDLSGLPDQMYFVEVIVSDNRRQTFKVLKQ